MIRRRSIHVEGLSHQAAIPVATRIGSLLVSSVIASFDVGTRTMPSETLAQVTNIYTKIDRILAESGATWDDVAKIEFWVPSDAVRAEVDSIWREHFPDVDSRPSRHIHVSGKFVSASFMAYLGD